MARYLTPAKIGLLALIDIYVSGAVPTEATVSVLHFIASHLIDGVVPSPSTDAPSATPQSSSSRGGRPSGRWQKATDAVSIVTSIDDFGRVLSPHGVTTAFAGRKLWDIFLRKLWRIDSLDALHRFFAVGLSRLLVMTKEERRLALEHGEDVHDEDAVRLMRTSPLGTFVRRSQLEFSRLPFQKAAELWRAFVKYRMPTAVYWGRRTSGGIDGYAFDCVLLAGQHDWGQGTPGISGIVYGDLRSDALSAPPMVSTEDIESILEFQVSQLQKFGNRILPEIRRHYRYLLEECVVVPSLSHYVNFLEAWRSGDYPTSFDLLHRYFDYTVQSRDRLFYQYALLNLAVLQADFGCFRDAVSSMLETVSTARENRDMACLNFSLNWLFQFGRAHPQFVRELESASMLGVGRETLSFLRVKAREVGSWVLWSSALLSEAKLTLCGGESVASAVELIVRSSKLVVSHNLKAAIGTQLSLTVAMWDRLGLASLSRMACEVFLRVHARNSTFDDELKVTCRLAGLLAGRGRFDDAMERLESLDPAALRAWKPGQYWRRFRGLLKLRRELHRNELGAADHLLSQLLQSRPEDSEPDMVYIVDALHVEALVRRGELGAALARTNTATVEHRQQGRDVALRVRLLIAKAVLCDSVGRPQTGFTLAVRAASAAWRARLLPVLWVALGALSNILVSLGEFEAAARLLAEVVPRALECDAAFVAGSLYSTLADAYLGLAGEWSEGAALALQSLSATAPAKNAVPAKISDTTRTTGMGKMGLTAVVARLEDRGRSDQQIDTIKMRDSDWDSVYAAVRRMLDLMSQAGEVLDSAFQHFAAIEDIEKQCEIRAKQATIMRVVGELDRAEDYAAQSLSLRAVPRHKQGTS